MVFERLVPNRNLLCIGCYGCFWNPIHTPSISLRLPQPPTRKCKSWYLLIHSNSVWHCSTPFVDALQTIHSTMENIGNCPPVDPQLFRPTSPAARNRRSSSIGIPVLSSLLGRKTTPLASELPPPVMTKLQEKSGGLPEVVSQMNPFGLVPSDGAISSTSSMHRNSLSSPSHYSPAPVDLDQPPATPISPPAANPEQSIAFDLISGDPQSSRRDVPNPPKPNPGKQRRRMSFDFASLKQSRHSLPPPPSPPQMQRSQTLWRQKKRSAGREQAEFLDKLGGIREPMSERQRVLNVKRARKMTQVPLLLFYGASGFLTPWTN
jgi:hypothetical protein